MASQLVLRFGTRRIAWNEFFFEYERYDDAWELVKAGGTNSFPIALAGTIRNLHSPPLEAKYKSSFLNFHPLYRKTGDPVRMESFEISIAHEDGKWLETYSVGTDIAMFGIWGIADRVEKQGKDPRNSSRTVTYVTHKLRLQPKFRRPVIGVEV